MTAGDRRPVQRWQGAFNPPRRDSDKPEEIAAALRWLAKASVPVSALEESRLITKALDACATNLNGEPFKPEYYRRRRRGFYGALKHAVRENQFSANPLDGASDLPTLDAVAGPGRSARQGPHGGTGQDSARAQAYDFRHAGVAWRLNSGVPATQVAEWAGHSVEVLQRIYAHCLDGEDGLWFERMDAALRR